MRRRSVKIEAGRLLSELTTFGVGGPAEALCVVNRVEEMQEALVYGREMGLRPLVLGRGSNLLFDDRGFDGLVILNKIDFIEWEGECCRVGAGVNFSLLGARTAKQGWAGLEFASGIPGTVGGAVVMNAGANGQETADVLVSVESVTPEGEVVIRARDAMAYAYRTSPFQSNSEAVVAATFVLEKSDEARAKQIEIIVRRKETQPLWEKSAGCMFRNPPGASAGQLIEAAGLKGLAVGDAIVSDLHANFVINQGKATSGEILELIQTVQERVKDASGFDLQREVKYIESV
jgi:UDP-N-acetylmuramate dehydrogenase